MTDLVEMEIPEEPRFQIFPQFVPSVFLTAAQVCRQLAYTPAQLSLLTQQHNFPLPHDVDRYVVRWLNSEVMDWRRQRDLALGFHLI